MNRRGFLGAVAGLGALLGIRKATGAECARVDEIVDARLGFNSGGYFVILDRKSGCFQRIMISKTQFDEIAEAQNRRAAWLQSYRRAALQHDLAILGLT